MTLTIELISSNTLKITLTKSDMIEYNISYQILDKKNPETKQFLMNIIDIVKEEKDIDLCSEKLYIEAFPQTNGGCLLYISVLSDKLKQRKNIYCEIVCETNNHSLLIKISDIIFKNYNHITKNSQLYYYQGTYRIILTLFSDTENKICDLLDEYMILWNKSEIVSELTKEHFTKIVDRKAIELLSELA